MSLRALLRALFTSCLLLAALTPIRAMALESSGGEYVPLPYSRLFTVTSANAFSASEVRTYQVAGLNGVPASGVAAVVMDISASGSSVTDSKLTAWTPGTPMPASASLRFGSTNVPRSNTVVVQLDAAGKVNIANGQGVTTLNVDVQGYFTDVVGSGSPGAFVPTTPATVFDTQAGVGTTKAQLAGGETRTVGVVANGGEVPVGATGVFANITVSAINSKGGLVAAASSPLPSNPIVNYSPGGPESSGSFLPLDSAGNFLIRNDGADGVQVAISVQGYFVSAGSTGGGFHAGPITVAANTKDAQPIPANGRLVVRLGGVAGVPRWEARAVLVQLAVKDHTASGSVSMDGLDFVMPSAPVASFSGSEPALDMMVSSVVRLGADESIVVYNQSNGPLDVTVNTMGWFGWPPALDDALDESDSGLDGETDIGTLDEATPLPDGTFAKPILPKPSPSGCAGKTPNPHISTKGPKTIGKIKGYSQTKCDVNVPSLGLTIYLYKNQAFGWDMKDVAAAVEIDAYKAANSALTKCVNGEYRTSANHFSVEADGSYTRSTKNVNTVDGC